MIYTAANSFDDIRERTVADFGCGCGMLSIAAALMGAEKVYALDIDPDALAICKRNLEDLGIIDLPSESEGSAEDEESADDEDAEESDTREQVSECESKDTSKQDSSSDDDSYYSETSSIREACMKEELGTDDEIDQGDGPLVELFNGDVLDEKFLKSSIATKGTINTILMNPPFGTKNNAGIDVAFLKAGLSLAESNPNLRAIYSMHKTSTREHLKRKAEEWKCSFTVIAEMKFDLPAKYDFHKKDNVIIQVDLLRFGLRN